MLKYICLALLLVGAFATVVIDPTKCVPANNASIRSCQICRNYFLGSRFTSSNIQRYCDGLVIIGAIVIDGVIITPPVVPSPVVPSPPSPPVIPPLTQSAISNGNISQNAVSLQTGVNAGVQGTVQGGAAVSQNGQTGQSNFALTGQVDSKAGASGSSGAGQDLRAAAVILPSGGQFDSAVVSTGKQAFQSGVPGSASFQGSQSTVVTGSSSSATSSGTVSGTNGSQQFGQTTTATGKRL